MLENTSEYGSYEHKLHKSPKSAPVMPPPKYMANAI